MSSGAHRIAEKAEEQRGRDCVIPIGAKRSGGICFFIPPGILPGGTWAGCSQVMATTDHGTRFFQRVSQTSRLPLQPQLPTSGRSILSGE